MPRVPWKIQSAWIGILGVWLAAALIGRAGPPRPNQAGLLPLLSSGSKDALAGSLRGYLLQALPNPLYETDPNGAHKARKTRGSRKQGIWRKIRITAVNPSDNLVVDLRDVSSPEAGKLTFGVFLALGLILDQNGNNGLANLADIAAAGVLTLQNGYVLTTGGDLINFGYLLLDATSQLNVSGNYTQDAAATLEIQLGGAGGPSGQLNVAGAANLNGTLTLTPENGYVPTTGDSFAILTFATRNGSDFANPPAGFNESFDDGNGILTVVAQ